MSRKNVVKKTGLAASGGISAGSAYGFGNSPALMDMISAEAGTGRNL